jgi:hypothetical protein
MRLTAKRIRIREDAILIDTLERIGIHFVVGVAAIIHCHALPPDSQLFLRDMKPEPCGGVAPGQATDTTHEQDSKGIREPAPSWC